MQLETAQPVVRLNLGRLDQRYPREDGLRQADGRNQVSGVLLQLGLSSDLVDHCKEHSHGEKSKYGEDRSNHVRLRLIASTRGATVGRHVLADARSVYLAAVIGVEDSCGPV